MVINKRDISRFLEPIIWIATQLLLAFILLNMTITTYEIMFYPSWSFQDALTLILFTYEIAVGIVVLNLFFAFTGYKRQSIEGLAAVFLVILWFVYEFGSDFTFTPFKTTMFIGVTIFSLLWPIFWERVNT